MGAAILILMLFVVGFLLGLIVAGIGAYLLTASYRHQVGASKEIATKAQARIEAQEQANQLAIANATTIFDEKIRQVTQSTLDSLTKQSQDLLKVAQDAANSQFELRTQAIAGTVKPVEELLKKLESQVEESKLQSAGIVESIKNLTEAELGLRSQTNSLSEALSSNSVRGRWGEIQLRRVIELSGMLANCDFTEQTSIGENNRSRPDVIVRLPGGGTIPIDAKFPFDAFNKATQARDDKDRKDLLVSHAKAIRSHISDLGSKEYWKDLNGPEFVVAFISPDALLTTAFEYDVDLIEFAAGKGVLLATPITLIGLLRAVAYHWSQHSIAVNSTKIHKLGQELYERLSIVASKMDKHAKNLDSAVSSHNDLVASFEARLLPSARKMHELGVDSQEIDPPGPIEKSARNVISNELNTPEGSD